MFFCVSAKTSFCLVTCNAMPGRIAICANISAICCSCVISDAIAVAVFADAVAEDFSSARFARFASGTEMILTSFTILHL